MEKILISACFLGENVRYNAKPKALFHPIITKWHEQNRLVAICPEVSGGLSTPRPPAEFNTLQNKVITIKGDDVTAAFNLGAQKALQLCLSQNIKFALLKESSPSCGSNNVYDGSFQQQKIAGEGITTKLLREHGIQVFSETTLTQLINTIEN